jgi:hypothetical protein
MVVVKATYTCESSHLPKGPTKAGLPWALSAPKLETEPTAKRTDGEQPWMGRLSLSLSLSRVSGRVPGTACSMEPWHDNFFLVTSSSIVVGR